MKEQIILTKYHKINSIFKRDMDNPDKSLRGRFIIGEWATPYLEMLQDIQWQFTEKVDGTNIRVIMNPKEVIFGGRTNKATIPAYLQEHLNRTFVHSEMEDRLTCNELILFGEGYGNKIQKGGGDYFPDSKTECGFILFDVLINGNYQSRDFAEQIATALNIPLVPIIGTGTLSDGIDLCSGSGKFSSQLRSIEPEGLIAKPIQELKDRTGNRIITKIKFKDFQ